jgi:hypothetical protein
VLDCYGYGASNGAQNTGFGTLRSGDLKVSATTTNDYTVLPNAQGQIIASGDSGGPCFAKDASNVWRVSGITSWNRFTANEVLEAHQIAAPAFASWVRSIRGY